MTATEFAEALRAMVGVAEDEGLERPAMIAALAEVVDEAGRAVEGGPEEFVEALGLLVIAAAASGLDRAEVGAMILDQADAMREAEAE